MSSPKFEPIAVVGVSALFPGSLEKTGFWNDILAGKDLLREIPESHWLISDYYDADPTKPDKTYAKRGAFLSDVPFDPMEWGIPPSIVPQTDTTQLLALIVAKQVLDDATRGQFASVDRSKISCILGVTSGQELMGSMVARLQRPVWVKALREAGIPESEVVAICDRISQSYTKWEEANFPGLLGNVVAGRIANRLDIGGTNCVTDAACASTFSAMSMAINELVVGQSDLVIAGGCDTMNDIFMYMCFSKTPALSPSGDCRPFSADADGTMLGEGLGMVALKRLSDAEKAGDRVYAVIRGIGSSSDGKALSVYAPLPKGQARAVRRAYAIAGFGPDTVELIEAHGTGTKAGDAAEVEGLNIVFDEAAEAAGKKERNWCALGSVKSQIGHTKSAAGAASFIKAVMALHHKVLPPTIKVATPNPKMKIDESAFYLSTKARPWLRASDHPRRAGVSSFGFGGTNFHLAVEEYTGPAEHAPRSRVSPVEVVIATADDAKALSAELASMASDVEAAIRNEQTGPDGRGMLRFLARRSQEGLDARRKARAAVVAADDTELALKLKQASEKVLAGKPLAMGGVYFETGAHEGKVGFLFPGQGSQYVGMSGPVAMTWDAARAAFDLAEDTRFAGKTIGDVVFPKPALDAAKEKAQQAELTATEWAQPGLGASSLAYLRLMDAIGLIPSAVAGHSFGEVMALCAAGAIGPKDALMIARKRGELMAEAGQHTKGAMTAVVADAKSLRARIEKSGLDLVVANDNAPDQSVLSGPTTAIEQFEKTLAADKITFKRLDVATAFHSSVVSEATKPFTAFLEGVSFGLPKCDVFATATAGVYPSDGKAARALLGGQLAAPVRFVEQIEAMYAAGVRTFVEVGPGSVLSGLVGKILGDRPHRAIALDKRGATDLVAFQQGLARLAVAGLPVKLGALWAGFEESVDPRTKPKPKMKLMLNGSNYAKPYPPKGGAAALPKPNPERAPGSVGGGGASAPSAKPSMAMAAGGGGLQVVTSAPAAKVATPTTTKPTNGTTNGNGAHANGKPAAIATPAPSILKPQSPAAPASVSIQNAPSRPVMSPMTQQSNKPLAPNAQLAWIQAYQESQRQTAEAHATFAKAMGDAHAAFLRSAETSFVGLASLLTGQAPAMSAPVASAPMPSFAPAPAYAPPAPAYVAPAPAVAPPAPAYVAPAPAYAPPAPAYTPPAASPAPVAAAPKAAPAAAPQVDLMKTMLDVVATKTGYPVEMIGMEMELEADLGIDSIKRVEILAAVREKAPGLPDLDPAALGALRTVGQIVEHLQKHLPASNAPKSAAPAAAPAAKAAPIAGGSNVDLMKTMLEVVAAKTGYPVEMIGMEMELEADLGIDSIKRVEILAAVREKAPGLPDLDPAALGALRTVGQIVEHLQKHLPGGGASAPAPAKAAAPAAAAPAAKAAAPAANVDLMKTMLEVVAAKTGYPVEMIGMEMELEADLGIDSIKRVEILAAVREQAPGLPDLDPAALGALRTVGQIVEHLQKHLPAGGVAVPSSAATALQSPAAEAAPAKAHRFVLRASPRAASGIVSPALFEAQRLVITDDGRGIAHALAAALGTHGVRAEVVTEVPADADAAIVLAGLRAVPSVDAAVAASREAFRAGRAFAARAAAHGGLFVTVQDTGGDFGLSGCTAEPLRAWAGGFAGLAKTASQEWPKVSVRAIDVACGGRAPELVAAALAHELVHGSTDLEVGLAESGARVVLESAAASIAASAPTLSPGDIVVASGGARGVTAATLIALAGATKCRLVLAGRTALEDEPAAARGVEGDAALKKALLDEAKRTGEKVTPAELGKRVERIVNAREVRGTIAAIEAAGGAARYVAVDVQDAAGLSKVLDEVRASWGAPISGIVHGAGVLADKLIAEKTDAAFDRVFDTKVNGLRALLAATSRDPLKIIAMFSSVAARTGNQGQVDYAMANGILNKVASAERARREASGQPCVVKSFGWGPWEGGMVTPQLKARFQELGVPLIALDAGARWLVDELASGSGSDVELVLGGEPKPEALLGGAPKTTHRFGVLIDRHSHPFVSSHVVKGGAVLPAVSAVELFARAAKALRPDLVVAAVREVAVLKGIVLSRYEAEGDRFVIEAKGGLEGKSVRLAMTLTNTKGQPHYRAVVDLAHAVPAGGAAPELGALSPIDDVVYDGFVLFHGPALHAIEAVKGESQRGIEGTLASGRTLGWAPAVADAAITDTAILDGALQLAVLWTKHVVGGASLPTAIGSVTLHGALPAAGRVRCVVTAKSHTDSRASFDIAIAGERGVIATLSDVDVHVLPGSREEVASRRAAARA
jgi:acyl transferase domain-containing protein